MGRRSQFGSPQFGLLHVPQPPQPTSIAINELRPPGAHLNFPSASVVPKHFFFDGIVPTHFVLSKTHGIDFDKSTPPDDHLFVLVGV